MKEGTVHGNAEQTTDNRNTTDKSATTKRVKENAQRTELDSNPRYLVTICERLTTYAFRLRSLLVVIRFKRAYNSVIIIHKPKSLS